MLGPPEIPLSSSSAPSRWPCLSCTVFNLNIKESETAARRFKQRLLAAATARSINPSRKHVTVNHSFTKAVQTVYFEILLKHVILTMSVPHLVCSPPLSFIRADGGRGAVDWPQIWTWPSLWADPLQSHTVTDAAGPWLFCFVCLREPGVDHYLSSIFPSDIY